MDISACFQLSTALWQYLLDPSPITLTIPSSPVPSAYLMSDISLVNSTAPVCGMGIEGWKGQMGPAGNHEQLEQRDAMEASRSSALSTVGCHFGWSEFRE